MPRDIQMNQKKFNWPRIRNLPEGERQPFLDFLANQTRPMIEGVPMDEQDGYFESDYLNFKRVSPTPYRL